jgi:hypothetical protein
MKEIHLNSFAPSVMLGYSEKTAIYESGSGAPYTEFAGGFTLDWVPASRTVRSNSSLFVSHLVYGILF